MYMPCQNQVNCGYFIQQKGMPWMPYGVNTTEACSLISRVDIPTGLGYEALVAAFEREMG
jgi:hypothetical protein